MSHSLFFGLVLVPSVAGVISWGASTDGTGGVWSLSCDFPGQDLKNVLSTGSACATQCKATAGCSHFSWTSFNGGTCWMKTGHRFRTDAVDKNDNTAVCGLLPPYASNWANGCDFVGNDLSNARTLNSECGPKCQAVTGCTHYTWSNYNGGTCWLKSGPATGLVSKADNTMVCGIVTTGPTPPPPPPQGGRQVTIKNNCPKTVWIQSAQASPATPIFPIQKAVTGQTLTYTIPDAGWVSGVFWPKTGCDASGNNCLSGQSRPPCPTTGCTAPAETKAEFTFFGINSGKASWYDISLVDGYSLPMTITPRGGSYGNCVPTRCNLDLARCPIAEGNGIGDLRLRATDSSVTACMSPCKRWTTPVSQGGLGNPEATTYNGQWMCCPYPAISSPQCQAGPVVKTQYVALVRETCPTAYSYAFDDVNALHVCNTGTSFDIQLC